MGHDISEIHEVHVQMLLPSTNPLVPVSVAPSLGHDNMFGGTNLVKAPPCQRGTAPAKNNLMCEACGLGHYSDGAYCQVCPPGSAEIVVW